MSVADPQAAEGFVYVLTNAAMPGYIKIGLTQRDDVGERVRQLYTTGLPLPFEVHYAARVPDCRRLERTLHFVFGEMRIRKDREFFNIQPDLAKAIIELVAIKEEVLSDSDQDITPQQRAEIEKVKTRRERVTLEKLGIPVGATLAFTKDPSVTCQVAGPRTVTFRGQEQSLSAAALQAIRDMGYDWPTVSGFEYWLLDGVKLGSMTVADTVPAGGEPSP